MEARPRVNAPCGWTEPHSAHSWETPGVSGELNWCHGSEQEANDGDHALLDALKVAESENPHRRDCKMCVALTQMSDPVQQAVRAALAGTIGRDKLVAVLAAHGYPVGRRALVRHRQEGHS
jgi:hypothetical protein